MFPVFSLSGHAHLCADRIHRVDEYKATPMYIDTRNCALISPTFDTRSSIALTNGMEFFSAEPRQEILSAIDNAKQHAHNVAAQPCAVSDHILVDPMRIVAILPYIAQLRDYVEEHGYSIRSVSHVPLCLIVMDDGDTCLATKDTPAELVDKLDSARHA